MSKLENKPIIIFDGICNLCNNSVNIILKNDRKKQFIFVSFQSDAASNILLQYQIKKSKLNSIIYIEYGLVYEKSTAVLKIARKLDGFWKLFYFFIFIPKFLRDPVYQIISNNRYKWFGKRTFCRIDFSITKK